MQVWVRDVLEAQQLLDHQTGQRYSKSQVPTCAYSLLSASPMPWRLPAMLQAARTAQPCCCVTLAGMQGKACGTQLKQ